MAVVGIDFGNDNCYISVARQGGIETIANDYSMRDTPSFVGFGERQRILGVGAKSQFLTNLKRTVFDFKHLLGRSFDDPVAQAIITTVPYKVSEGPGGTILIETSYMGSDRQFTPEEVTAMLMTKLKETAEEALKTKVKDVVIGCPCYFTDRERRALLDAAAVAGLNVLKLMNETTSTALAYGIYKQDLPPPEEKARNVVFVDVGHIGIQASACSFNKGKLSMKACTFDRSCGGKSYDAKLAKYFAEDFKEKFKMDPCSVPRVYLKLLTEVEKIKKQMSANTNNLPLNIECFMEERDLSGRVDRTKFEELIAPEIARIEAVLQECLAVSEWKLDDIYSVEVVGGSTRIPAIKSAIERVFGKVPNTTLNADEAVSRGCALQCAILSPTFKVREFSVTDIQPFEIKLNWEAESDKGDMVVFPKFHQIPFSKLLTFYRRDNFTVEASYGSDVPVQNPFIGRFEVGEVKPLADGGNQKVKVKVRVNLNGVFTVSSASLIEKQEIEEEVPMDVDEQKSADGEKKPAEGESPEKNGSTEEKKPATAADAEMLDAAEAKPKTEKRKKTITKTIDLPVTPLAVGSLSRDKMERSTDQEKTMYNQDKQEIERLHAKNAVEEYIYGIREKIGEELEEYLTPDDKSKYSQQLEDTENWLYEDGEDVERSCYVDKLKELKLIGEASKKRKTEYEGRQAGIEALGHSLQMASKIVDMFRAGDELYNHLVPGDVDRVAKLIDEKREWMNKSVASLEKTPKTTNPSILVCQFYSERDAFEAVSRPILNKKKPKVEPPPPSPPKEDASNAKGDSTENGKSSESKVEENQNMETEGAQVNGGQMDLD